ncbi:MAG: hypothetical protein ACQKBY_09670 [Verrucomicrobiales bacterium]
MSIQQVLSTSTLGLLASAASLPAAVIFQDDFSTNPDPSNTSSPSASTWFLPSTGNNSEGSPGNNTPESVNTIPSGQSATPDAHPFASSALRIGFAYDQVSVRLGLNETWDSSKDYTLTFDWASTDHGTNTTHTFEVLMRADIGLLEHANTVVKSEQLANASNTPTFGQINPYSMTISGADISAASAEGQNIYLYFYKGENTEFYWVDNVSLTATPELGSLFLLSLASLWGLRRRR